MLNNIQVQFAFHDIAVAIEITKKMRFSHVFDSRVYNLKSIMGLPLFTSTALSL